MKEFRPGSWLLREYLTQKLGINYEIVVEASLKYPGGEYLREQLVVLSNVLANTGTFVRRS